MSDFHGMEDLLQDFLVEAADLLSGVDNKLVDLEQVSRRPRRCSTIFFVAFTRSRAVPASSMRRSWSRSVI